MPKCIQAETLTWLSKSSEIPEIQVVQSTDQTVENDAEKTKPRRRMSVVGCGLFSVNRRVIEKATDFLPKVSRVNNNIVKPTVDADSDETGFGEIPISNETAYAVGPDDQHLDIMVDEASFSSSNANMVIATNAQRDSRNSKKIPALLPLSNPMKINTDLQVPAVSNNTGRKPTEFNDFCPFRRLPNVPFAINGRPRKRSLSVDCYPSKPPPLETLFETEEEHASENGIAQDLPIVNTDEIQAAFQQTEETLNIVRKWVEIASQ